MTNRLSCLPLYARYTQRLPGRVRAVGETVGIDLRVRRPCSAFATPWSVRPTRVLERRGAIHRRQLLRLYKATDVIRGHGSSPERVDYLNPACGGVLVADLHHGVLGDLHPL